MTVRARLIGLLRAIPLVRAKWPGSSIMGSDGEARDTCGGPGSELTTPGELPGPVSDIAEKWRTLLIAEFEARS